MIDYNNHKTNNHERKQAMENVTQKNEIAHDFENEGGFTERLYKIRSEKRKNETL